VKLVFWLVGLAAALFIVGGIGTIAAFIARADATRVVFMYIFLAGLAPTMAFLLFSLGIAIYHFYLNRFAGRTPAGWFVSEKKREE
jgi:hypothetical protein